MTAALIPVLGSGVLLWILVRAAEAHGGPHPGWRRLLLGAAVFQGVLVVGLTELLGALQRLDSATVRVTWTGVLLLEVAWARRLLLRWGNPATRPPLSLTERAVCVGLGLLLAGVLVSALAAAPGTGDSITYHLSRVAHWQQNHSVAFFPTHNERQLFFPPFAEYAILHLQLLVGSDRLAALVQWSSLVGCLLAVSLLAQALGAGRFGQLMAVAFAGTIPLALLEGSSTQNDLVVAFWLLAAACFAWRAIETDANGSLAVAAGSCGLALLTKATAYLIVPALALGWVVGWVRGDRRLPWRRGLAAAALAATLPAGFWARNLAVYGELIGSAESRSYHATLDLQPAAIASRFLRGIVLHASAPPTRLHLPDRAATLVEGLERRLDVPAGEWRLDRAEWRYTLVREDRAAAPLHLFLAVCVVAVLLVGRRNRPGAVWWHATGVAAGALLVGAVLEWNPWVVRFHLQLMLLAAPLIGITAAGRYRRLSAGLALSMAAAATYPVAGNQLRPLVGPGMVLRTSRETEYFASISTERSEVYRAVIRELTASGDSVVGLALGSDGFEYPFWSLIPGVRSGQVRLCHVWVTNPSRALTTEPPCRPQVVVAGAVEVDTVHFDSTEYLRSRRGPLELFRPLRR